MAAILALNHTGSFDWDLDRDLMYLDAAAREVFDLGQDAYDQNPRSLTGRVAEADAPRLNELVRAALRDGRAAYGAYFRVRCRDGHLRWTHTQGHIHREPDGRPRRVVGIVRDATAELGDPAREQAAEGAAEGERRRGADLVEEVTKALAHARTVSEVRQALRDTPQLARLGAMSAVLGLVEGARIHIHRVDPDSPLISNLEHPRIDDDLPMAQSVRRRAACFVASRRQFAGEYPRLWRHFEALGIASAAYLPLTAQAQTLGVLGLLFPEERAFPPEERTLLTALGSVIASSLQRAMLLEQEHELAAYLQQAMLPRRIPGVPGVRIAVRYRSAGLGREIGGDWYDVIPLPGGRVAAVIGDVEGHDTRATAVMGQLRIVMRAYAAEGHPAAVVMARASAFLHDLDTDRFATCLYAEHDPATGWLRLVRAGHLPPVLRRADGATLPLAVPGTLPLGVLPPSGVARWPVTDLMLGRGETLLMCTDGLVERRGADLDEGLGRVVDALREGPADLEELADRIGEAPPDAGLAAEDDMALVLLRRALSGPPPLA